MERLIKIQSAIQMIERLTISQSKCYSVFNYVDESTVEITCYCTEQAIKWFALLQRSKDAILDIENTKIRIHIY